MRLCSKQSSLISFYALPSSGKSKDTVVHCIFRAIGKNFIIDCLSSYCFEFFNDNVERFQFRYLWCRMSHY